MVLVGQAVHDGHVIQSYRVPSNQRGYVGKDGKTYQFHIDGSDRTIEVVAALNGKPDGFWQEAAKDVIAADKANAETKKP